MDRKNLRILGRLFPVILFSSVYLLLAVSLKLFPNSFREQAITNRRNLLDTLGFNAEVSLHPSNLQVGSRSRLDLHRIYIGFEAENAPEKTGINQLCIKRVSLIEFDRISTREFGNLIFSRETSFTGITSPRCINLSEPNMKANIDRPDISKYIYRLDFNNPESSNTPAPGVDDIFGPRPFPTDAPLKASFLSSVDQFWYPFDSFSTNFCLVIDYTLAAVSESSNPLVKTNTRSFSKASVYIPNTQGWEITTGEMDVSESHGLSQYGRVDKGVTAVTLGFRRPVFDRIVFTFLILVMFLFIILLSLIDPIDTFIEGGVAVFLGIFSLREFILPPLTEVRTVVDVAVWGLYFAFAGALSLHLTSILKSLLYVRRAEDSPSTSPPSLSSTKEWRLPARENEVIPVTDKNDYSAVNLLSAVYVVGQVVTLFLRGKRKSRTKSSSE